MKTVRDLIDELRGLDPDAVVIMSSDAEGNSFSPLADITVGKYEADTTWSGEFLPDLGPDDDPADYLHDFNGCDSLPVAVALWPVN